MTTGPAPATDHTGPDGLAVVGQALLARARRDADAEAGAARAYTDATVAGARAQADRLVAAARAQGAADAAEALSGQRSRSLREARGRVLRAEREAYDELRRLSVAEVTGLLEQLGLLVRARLEHEAAERLGPDAILVDGAHGPTATAGRRRLALEPEHLVDLALAALGSELAGLWSP